MCFSATFRCGDEKNQFCVPVGTCKVDRVRQSREGQGRFGNRRCSAVRDGDAAVDAGASFFFACSCGLGKSSCIRCATSINDECCQVSYDVTWCLAQVDVERDKAGGDDW